MRASSPQSGRLVMRLIATLALAAAAALASAAQAEDITVKLGVLNDMSSLYSDIGGQGSVIAAKMAIAGFRSRRPRHEGRARQRRPPQQARRRRQHRAAMDRRRSRRRHPRRADVERRARGQRGHSREEQGVPGLGRGHLRSHRSEMLAQYRALDLRHLDARQLAPASRW